MVQGGKAVRETLSSTYRVRILVATHAFLETVDSRLLSRAGECLELSETELTELGSVESNRDALAVVEIPPVAPVSTATNDLSIVLDDIRDPGNLGTMIRTADWYGIRQIVASSETADLYNPKVISATMGSFLRVNVHYTPLDRFLSANSLPVLGAVMNGVDVHGFRWPKGGLLVIGNEAHGISPAAEKFISHRITIPRIGMAESLNASTALAVMLDNYRR